MDTTGDTGPTSDQNANQGLNDPAVVNGGSGDGSTGGFWSAFGGLGKTATGLITALNAPSTAAAQAKTSSANMAAYLPFIIAGAVILVLVLVVGRRK